MAVLNLTPDSFSDGGRFTASGIDRVNTLLEDGADIIDIGGESTAPGNTPVSAEEEIERILSTVRQASAGCFVSVDTFRARTAELCLSAGARMINDVSALRAEPLLAEHIREHKAQVVLMHSKETGSAPHASMGVKHYQDAVQEISSFLLSRAEFAVSKGIPERNIILDPGMGRFLSHDPEYSWIVLEQFDRLVELLSPFPVLIATSRKGFLPGPLKDRDPVSQLSALAACLKGAKYVRTHCPGMARDFFHCWKRLFKDSTL